VVSLAGTGFAPAVEVGEAPALMFHGTEDDTVPFGWAEDFCAEVNAAGVACELRTRATDHSGLWGYKAEIEQEMIEWAAPHLTLATAAPDLPASFDDVAWGHPFFHPVRWAAIEGVTTGYEDGTFRPTSVLTRQTALAWLWRLAGSPAPADDPAFTDVPADHPFADPIAWAGESGITTGYSDGTFGPTGVLTRQAVMAWLWRLAGSPAPAGDPAFTDVPAVHPFADPIAWAAESDITTGYSDGTFGPVDPVTRQSAAAWLWRQAPPD